LVLCLHEIGGNIKITIDWEMWVLGDVTYLYNTCITLKVLAHSHVSLGTPRSNGRRKIEVGDVGLVGAVGEIGSHFHAGRRRLQSIQRARRYVLRETSSDARHNQILECELRCPPRLRPTSYWPQPVTMTSSGGSHPPFRASLRSVERHAYGSRSVARCHSC
jgi:hypothetical protein